MRVRAKEKIYYGRREYLPGEDYEMDDREAQEANLLCLLGKIELVTTNAPKAKTETQPSQPPTYQTTAHEPEPAPEDDGDQETQGEEGQPQRKRYYRRRDMRAEDK